MRLCKDCSLLVFNKNKLMKIRETIVRQVLFLFQIRRLVGVNKINDFAKILEIKTYSKNTINSYVSFFRFYESVFKIKYWKDLKGKDILNYSYQFIAHKNLSYSSQKQLLSAVKLFYLEVYKRYINLDSLGPKNKPKQTS